MPTAERAGLLDGKSPNKKAYERLGNAVFAQAYESDELLRLAAEATDQEVRNIMGGLKIAAGKMSRLKGTGTYDIRPLIVEAAEIAVNAKRADQSLKQYIEQGDMGRNPYVIPVLEMMAENSRSAKAMGENLSNLADLFYSEADRPDTDMFGDVDKRPPQQLMDEAYGTGQIEPGDSAPAGEQPGAEPTTRGDEQRSEPVPGVDSSDPGARAETPDAEAVEGEGQSPAGEAESAVEKPGFLEEAASTNDAELDEALAELAALLKPDPNTLNTGRATEVVIAGTKVGVLYIQKGVIKFAQWSEAIIKQLGLMGIEPDLIKPHLKEIYAATQQRVTDEQFDQMDDARAVRAFDLDSLGQESQFDDEKTPDQDTQTDLSNVDDRQNDDLPTKKEESGTEAETDLFGEVPAEEQSLADAKREKDAKRSGDGEEVPADIDGGLFSNQQDQASIFDLKPTDAKKSPELYFEFNGNRAEVDSLEDARDKFNQLRDRLDEEGAAGARAMGTQFFVYNGKNEKVAKISYNGRVWDMDGNPMFEGPSAAEIDEKANAAATSPENALPDPTPGQIEADNYKKGEPFTLHGQTIVIENPRGSMRGDKETGGKVWQNKMAAHYGDIKGTTAADGDNLDVFVGESPESQRVFVIDQMQRGDKGTFDEHKVLLAFDSQEQAEQAYLDSYDKGWKLGPVTELSVDQFKEWVKSGDHTKPIKGQDVAFEGRPSVLAEHIYKGLDGINNNRDLKTLLAEFNGVKSSAINQKQMKEAQELVELALVRRARDTMRSSQDEKAVYDKLVSQYNSQPLLNVRSSTSMENQAYSTPAPLAMIASQYAGIDAMSKVYEPTAGNGMLLIGAEVENSTVNELNDERADNLRAQGYSVSQSNAAEESPKSASVDAVITNPPFGKLRDSDGKIREVKVDGYKLREIDHLIAAKALGAMKDNGRAALIIGANRSSGVIGSNDRVFFNWLYGHYSVADHFEVDGDLYKRQGAGWPVRVIIINGRSKSETFSPKTGEIQRLSTWEQIYERYNDRVDAIGQRAIAGRENGVELGNQQDAKPGSGAASLANGGQVGTIDGSGRKPQSDSGGSARSTDGRKSSGEQQGQGGIDAGGQQPGLAVEPGGVPAAEQQSQPDPDGNSIIPAANTIVGGGSAGEKPSGVAPKKKRKKKGPGGASSFQTPYPVRSNGFNDAVLVPNNMAESVDIALRDIESQIGAPVDEYVMDKLGYESREDLYKAFMGLQVDTIAAAIYNFEEKGKGIIIADQTGVGKGRQAAGIIRYAKRVGKTPIFASVTPNLFTDMYDDLHDIGETSMSPFILNNGESISSRHGNIPAMKPAARKNLLQEIISTGELPQGNDAFFMTYSQVNTENVQRQVVAALKHNAIFVLDEAHNVAGERESVGKKNGQNVKKVTGAGFMYEMIDDAPVVYLSATYAKRADNMPVYYRTDLLDAVDSADELIEAVNSGGVPVQQVMSSMLTESGQLFRRERSFEGISIPTTIDYQRGDAHRELADAVTEGLREVVHADRVFETVFFDAYKEAAEGAGGTSIMAGNKAGSGVDHNNFNAVVHNYVRQMLLALKSDQAADKAIEAYKAGKKPVIALESTMGSFLADYAEREGLSEGDVVNADYRDILLKALERTRRIRTVDGKGDSVVVQIELNQLDSITKSAYIKAEEMINDLPLEDLPLSPIDHMRQRLEDAGIRVAEITGRTNKIDYSGEDPVLAKIDPKERKNKRAIVDRFNNAGLDALILNVAGSTGLSIHASEKFSDKKPRKMIVAQPMQDINILMQMLGRINRTGQTVLPEYELLGADLPAEKRPMAVTSRKMASLNANTSANDESDTSIEAPDMMNKYGDRVINEYLKDNPEIAAALSVPTTADDGVPLAGLAMKFTGRMALLPVKKQEEIYSEIERAYEEEIEYLTKTGQNDLVAATVELDARIMDSRIVYEGKAPETIFGGNTTLHKIDAKYQGNSPTPRDVESALDKAHGKPTIQEIIAKKERDNSYLNKLVERRDEAMKNAGEFQENGKEGSGDDADAKYVNKLAKLRSSFDKAEEALKSYEAGKRLAVQKMLRFEVGKRVRLDIGDEEVTGVVVSIKDSHKKGKGNPWSSSKTRIGFMVNSGVRTVELPISKLGYGEGIYIADLSGKGKEGLDGIFRQMDTNRREIRYVATGNLISGMAKLDGGRIVNFTDRQGAVHQGILMPKKFGKDNEFDTAGMQNAFPVRDPSVVKKLLVNGGSSLAGAGGVFSPGQAVRITRNQGVWVVQVPKSNKDSTGKAVKFDGPIRDIVGDFYGSGKTMTAQFRDGQLSDVVDRVMKITPLYVSPSMRDMAIVAGAPPAQEAVKSFDGDTGNAQPEYKAEPGREPEPTAAQQAVPTAKNSSEKPTGAPSENPASEKMNTWEAPHTKTGEMTYMANLQRRVDRNEFGAMKAIAKRHGGYWSRFGKAGFLFKSQADRASFLSEIDANGVSDYISDYDAEGASVQSRERDQGVSSAAPNDNDGQIPLFFDESSSGEEKLQEFKDYYATEVVNREVGELRSATTKINNSRDLAQLVAPIRKNAQERFMVVATDKNNEILLVSAHSKGLKSSSMVDPLTVVSQVAGIDGAAKIHYAHNHPSGQPKPSKSDKNITARLAQMLDGTGIEPGMHVIVAGKKAVEFSDDFLKPSSIFPLSLKMTRCLL
jgi:hypothetical protein